MRHTLIAAMTISALLLAAPNSRAAGEGGSGGGGATPKPSRAPIGAPPALNSDALNSAYEFRNRMSSDPVCQELARQSDSIYADTEMKVNKKEQALGQLRNRAKAAGCL